MVENNHVSSWVYEPVKPYSAPLTVSAIANQDKKKHSEFVDIAREGLRFLMEEHPGGKLQGFMFRDEAVSYERKLSVAPFFYDICYSDKNIIVLGDAKVNKRDLAERHTVDQLRAYIDELSLPGNAHKDKFLLLCTPENLGGLARTIVEDKISPYMPDDIEVLYISEYTGKTIPAPEGWGDIDFTEARQTFISSRKYGNVPVTEKWVPVENLQFDPANSRLIGVEDELMTQEECKQKLLADGDCADTPDAFARRSQMLIGSIREPIWITSDGTVQVGNSRTAFSKHALEITNHHAPGYEMVRVYDFGDADPNMLYDLKQEEQSMTKLDQGAIHDAFDMWRRYTKRNQSIDELYEEVYNRKYTKEIIQQAIESVEWMVANGYNQDSTAKEMYYASFALAGVQWATVNKKYEQAGITRNTLMSAAAKSPDPRWRTMKAIKSLTKALQDPLAPQWKIEALKNFIFQKKGWINHSDWEKSYKKLEEQNRYSANLASRQLSTAETSVANTLREVQFTINQLQAGITDSTKGNIYSRNELKKLQQKTYSLVNIVTELKNSLGDAMFEYEQLSDKLPH